MSALFATSIWMTPLIGTPMSGTAQAAGREEQSQGPAYRYWSYWTDIDGSWSFATSGPGARGSADGDVEGWRFARTTAQGDEPPRISGRTAFDDACGEVSATAGMKRVAIVIDPGLAADAPPGQRPGEPRTACAVIPADASSAIALSAVSDVRVDGGLVCGLDGYPTGECAPVVSADAPVEVPTDPATRASSDSSDAGTSATANSVVQQGSPIPVVVTAIVVVIGAAIAWLTIRRRRRTS